MKFVEPRIMKISPQLEVKRILPFREQRMVGPFCFLDHMGPIQASPNHEQDVLAHPHIGLATITYLFSGGLYHQDSIGSKNTILPGDVNLMVAGKGIVHSERVPQEMMGQKSVLHGLQSWIALPQDQEDCEPSFTHFPKGQLPTFLWNGVTVNLLLGEFAGKTSPISFPWKVFYADFKGSKGQKFHLDCFEDELAIYSVLGNLSVGETHFNQPTLIVFNRGESLEVQCQTDCEFVIFGGAQMPEGRLMHWNFVSTRAEKIEQAKINWDEQRFPKIPGEVGFVPRPRS